MNIKKRLIHLAQMSGKDRRLGRTTMLMKAAKELDAIVLAASLDHADLLKREHGVVAKSMEVNLEGFSGPFIFDHFAIETILIKAANKIEELEKEVARLNHAIEEIMCGPNADDYDRLSENK
jgi:hypothetical protein